MQTSLFFPSSLLVFLCLCPFLDSAHLDSPCSSGRFPCHPTFATLISSFKIIPKFFTIYKMKLQKHHFSPCAKFRHEENSLFKFICSERHHPTLIFSVHTNSCSFSKETLISLLYNFTINWAKNKTFNFSHEPKERNHFLFAYFLASAQ